MFGVMGEPPAPCMESGIRNQEFFIYNTTEQMKK